MSSRILVTGSRELVGPEHRAIVRRTLDEVALGLSAPLTVVEGECRGPDLLAREWAEDHGHAVDPHPYWGHLGRGGGPARNAHMVSLGADICVAFLAPGSRGAAGCAKLAENAGIPVLPVDVPL